MKQLLQRLDSGETYIVDAPRPTPRGPQLLVRSRASIISAGTERMLVSFGRSNLVQKARQQPDKVKEVIGKVRTDGIGPTMDAVRSKLGEPTTLGYCNAGVVEETGDRPGSFAVGDRVVTNGPHGEYVRVAHTLAARIPDGVSFEEAAFTPLAAIALQGIRIAKPTLGETVVVYGLGLIGLLAVQLLRSHGCRVIGIDLSPERLALAEGFGAEPVSGAAGAALPDRVRALTDGVGADAVLLTLASSSDEPVHLAAEMSRKRGRLVLVGVTGLSLRRDDFYKKELSFAVSCSYGPGRHDPGYEQEGRDYPLGFVRWTEQRNFAAVLQLMAEGKIRTGPLVTHTFPFEEAGAAYDLLTSADADPLGIVLEYRQENEASAGKGQVIERAVRPKRPDARGVVGVIGAGSFTTRFMLPALTETEAELRTIVSSGGTSAAVAGRKFDFQRVSADTDSVFDDPDIDTVFIMTRHDSHARLVVRALEAGKNVFVEKPLALTMEELGGVASAAKASPGLLMVGFNRRFTPLTAALREPLDGRLGPLSVVATINAGRIPADHWTQDPAVGGGRIVGEACHWIDLARALVGAPLSAVEIVAAADGSGKAIDDIAHISLAFADGSTGVVNYLASGSRSYPKERVEVHFDGKSAVIDNWRKLERYGISGGGWPFPRRADKGHEAEIRAWMDAVREGGASPIPLEELLEVSRFSIEAAERARRPRLSAD